MDKKVQADQLVSFIYKIVLNPDFFTYTDSQLWLFSLRQKWKIMSCKMKIEQLKEAICNGNEEVNSGGCF